MCRSRITLPAVAVFLPLVVAVATPPPAGAYDLVRVHRTDADTTTVAQGKLLFSRHCVACHGVEARGGVMGPSLASGDFLYGGGDTDLFRSISEGRPDGMPAWSPRLTESEIGMLVAYLRSLQRAP